jgi:hypothetical protein
VRPGVSIHRLLAGFELSQHTQDTSPVPGPHGTARQSFQHSAPLIPARTLCRHHRHRQRRRHLTELAALVREGGRVVSMKSAASQDDLAGRGITAVNIQTMANADRLTALGELYESGRWRQNAFGSAFTPLR